MRSYLIALAGLLVLVAVAFGVAWYGTRPTDAPVALAPEPAPAIAVPAPVTLVPPPAGPAVFPSQRAEPPPPPLIMDPVPPPPAPGSWEAVPPVARLSALGALGGPISRAIADRGDALSACFDVDAQSRHSTTAPSEAADAAGEDGRTTPTVMLEIETGAGVVRIVDATVDARAGASDGLFSCAQRVLRGVTAQTPAAKPGRRYRVPFALTP